MAFTVKRAPVVAILVAAFALTGCAGGESSTEDEPTASAPAEEAAIACPVRIAAIAPLTGRSAAYGTAGKIGREIATETINASEEKVLGCEVEVDYIDNGSDPSKIPGLITRALSQDYAYVTQFAAGTDVALQFFDTQGKLSIGANGEEPYNDPAEFPLWFDMASSINEPIRRLGRDLEEAGHRRIALVQSTIGNFGGNDAKDLEEVLDEAELVVVESVPLDLADASGVAIKVRDAEPDAVIVDLFGPVLGTVLSALTAEGVDVPRFGGYYAAAGNPAASAEPSEVADMIVSTYRAAIQGGVDGMTDFARKVAERADGGRVNVPITAASFNHDAFIAWAAAVNATGSLEDEVLAAWFEENGDTEMPLLVSYDPKVTGYTADNHIAVGSYGLAEADSLDELGMMTETTIPPKG